MSSESKLIVEVWESFKDLLPSNRREDAALKLLRLFEEYGFEIEEAGGEDQYLDDAIDLLKDDSHDIDSDEDEY